MAKPYIDKDGNIRYVYEIGDQVKITTDFEGFPAGSIGTVTSHYVDKFAMDILGHEITIEYEIGNRNYHHELVIPRPGQ